MAGMSREDPMKTLEPTSTSGQLQRAFGVIDIYLFDQLLRGNFDERRRVLEAGCGNGRNLVYFLRTGFEVYACDRDPSAVAAARRLAIDLAPQLDGDHFQVAEVDALPWPDASMDGVVSSAVLHFAKDEEHFDRMLREMWRVLRPGGIFFARLASSIGIESVVHWRDGRTARLPDGSDRFLVDEALLLKYTDRLGADLVDPLKTTNVQNLRAMTTWVLSKRR
jgi:tellurite methyltransferase